MDFGQNHNCLGNDLKLMLLLTHLILVEKFFCSTSMLDSSFHTKILCFYPSACDSCFISHTQVEFSYSETNVGDVLSVIQSSARTAPNMWMKFTRWSFIVFFLVESAIIEDWLHAIIMKYKMDDQWCYYLDMVRRRIHSPLTESWVR